MMHVYFSDLWLVYILLPFSFVCCGNAENLLTICWQFWLVGCCLSKFFMILLFPNFLKASKSSLPFHTLFYKVFAISSCFYSSQEDLANASWAQCKAQTPMTMWVLSSPRKQLCSFWSGIGLRDLVSQELSTSYRLSLKCGFSALPVTGFVAEFGLPRSWTLFFACWWLISFLSNEPACPTFFFLLMFFPFSLSKDGSSTSCVR